MKALKTIVSVIPGPALVFVGQWMKMLSSTSLANPVWQNAADKIALGLGAILTVFIAIGWADAGKEDLKYYFRVGCGVVIAGLAICWGTWLALGPPTPGTKSLDSTWWQGFWETVYVVTQATLVGTISVGALSIKEEKPWLFWVKLIVAVSLVLLVAYLIFRR
jgi:hypothetical protein